MSNIISSHGSPSGSVFGVIGDLIGTSEGKAYFKYNYDTLNIGWDAPSVTSTPIITPTPSKTPYPPEAFYCTEIQASGSSKCNNECRLEWTTDGESTIVYGVNWSRPATNSDPLLIMGNLGGISSSLMDGSISYQGFSSQGFSGNYWLSFSRPSSILDIPKMKISIAEGSGAIRSARLISYTSGSSTVAVLRAYNINGNYVFHTRNLSGVLNSGTGGTISEILSNKNQTVSVSGISTQESVELLEIIGYNNKLYFSPREIKECKPTPTPTPTPSITPTQTVTPSITPTQTVTPSSSGLPPVTTATPTPTITVTSTQTPTPTKTSTPTPTSTTTPLVSFWIDYDEYGRAQATWVTSGGDLYPSPLDTGIPFTTSNVFGTMQLNSLNVKYGINIRYASVGSPDPRNRPYQIDAKTDLFGLYNFNYVDPYGIVRNANGVSTPNTLVYAVACGSSVSSVVRGSATLSPRYC